MGVSEPQRIVYLPSRPVPAAEANAVHAAHMASAWCRQGYDVTLLAPAPWPWVPGAGTILREQHGADARLRRRSLWTPRPRVLRHRVHAAWLRCHLAWIRPALVHARHLRGAELAARLGWPVLFEAHMPMSARGSGTAERFADLIDAPGFRGLVVISHALAHDFAQHYPQLAGRIIVAPDAAPQWPDPGPASTAGEMRAGYIGSLYPGKGMEVIAAIAPDNPDIRFDVVGGTAGEIAQWRERLVGADHVTFHGHQPHARVRAHMARCSVLLAPYQPRVEAQGGRDDIARWMSPLKLFEYMAANRPVVASDLPVLREILRHNDNAILVPPDDPAAWSAALEQLRREPETARRIAATARAEYEREYTWDRRAQRIREAIVQ